MHTFLKRPYTALPCSLYRQGKNRDRTPSVCVCTDRDPDGAQHYAVSNYEQEHGSAPSYPAHR